MQYAPPISSNIGTILANAGANSAQSYMQGMQQFSKGISDGLESAAGSIAGGMTKAGENKMTSEYLDSLAGQYSQTPGIDGQTPLMSQDELDKFSKMSLGAKQGMIVPKQAQFDQILKNQYLTAQIQGFGQRNAIQNQVPANQVPMGTNAAPAAQPYAGPNVNWNVVR